MKHLQSLVFIVMATAMVFATPYHQSRRAIGNSSDTNRQKQEIYNETERLLGNLTDEEKEKYVQKPMEKRMSCKCNEKNKLFFCNLACVLDGQSDKFSRMRHLLAAYNKNNTDCHLGIQNSRSRSQKISHCRLKTNRQYLVEDLLLDTKECSTSC